jgi:hypothetical protein
MDVQSKVQLECMHACMLRVRRRWEPTKGEPTKGNCNGTMIDSKLVVPRSLVVACELILLSAGINRAMFVVRIRR